MIYEITLLKNSYWYPYFRQMPIVKFTCLWFQDEIEATQNPLIFHGLREYTKNLLRDWRDFKAVLEKYPNTFPERFIDQGLFLNTYAQTCTRCFGYGLPSTCMVPMADNLNHTHEQISHEIMNVPLHTEPEANAEYATPSKMINNFSTLFEHLNITSDDPCVTNGNYNKSVFI